MFNDKLVHHCFLTARIAYICLLKYNTAVINPAVPALNSYGYDKLHVVGLSTAAVVFNEQPGVGFVVGLPLAV